MNKYTVLDAGLGSLRWQVTNPKGIVIAVFNSEARANHCAVTMTTLDAKKIKYADLD